MFVLFCFLFFVFCFLFFVFCFFNLYKHDYLKTDLQKPENKYLTTSTPYFHALPPLSPPYCVVSPRYFLLIKEERWKGRGGKRGKEGERREGRGGGERRKPGIRHPRQSKIDLILSKKKKRGKEKEEKS